MRAPVFELLAQAPSQISEGLLNTGGFSPREALFQFARDTRPSIPTDIAVVTGSNGKTTVKEMLGAALQGWPSHISPANQNTKVALALQLLRLPASCKTAIFEMGARRQNDFQIPLSYLQPRVAGLLNVGTAHAGEFGSLENLVHEKLSVLEAPSARMLIVPREDQRIWQKALAQNKPVISFGFSEGSDVRILAETLNSLTLNVRGETFEFPTVFLGPQKALNMAAVMAYSLALDLPRQAVIQGLSTFSGVARRFQSFQWQGTMAIDDAFNASPESMIGGLQQLHALAEGKKLLVVLGTMLELGDHSATAHQHVGGCLVEIFAKQVQNKTLHLVTIGDEALALGEEAQRQGLAPTQLQHYANAALARGPLLAIKNQFDMVYFKASRGMQLQKIFAET